MPQTRPARPHPTAAAATEADLQAWWEHCFGELANVGVDPQLLGEAMLAIAAKHLAETLGPRRLGHACQLIAQQLFHDAQQIDAATAGAIRPQGRHA